MLKLSVSPWYTCILLSSAPGWVEKEERKHWTRSIYSRTREILKKKCPFLSIGHVRSHYKLKKNEWRCSPAWLLNEEAFNRKQWPDGFSFLLSTCLVELSQLFTLQIYLVELLKSSTLVERVLCFCELSKVNLRWTKLDTVHISFLASMSSWVPPGSHLGNVG